MKSENIQKFYNNNNFPGPYSFDQLKNYKTENNRYINVINQSITENTSVLDVGCGTGFITNLLALRHSNCHFTGIDFSNAVDYANQFSKHNGITNTSFYQVDFFEYKSATQFDVVIAQSFITHIPDYTDALIRLKNMVKPNGILLISVYNRIGFNMKKLLPITYSNQRLELDQTSNPFEVSFYNQEFVDVFSEFKKIKIVPSIQNKLVNFSNIFNAKNGGLTLYSFKHIHD